jgi:23S rRNA pseudouridine2605 synthase
MIGEGRVVVNGAVVTDAGHKIDPNADAVVVDGKTVGVAAAAGRAAKDSMWVKVHKPKGAVAALSDARGRKCLGDLVPDARERGLLPVGRLGREAAGLLLLTDDREGAHLLASKEAGLVRVYKIVVEKGMPAPQALAALAKGVEVEMGAGEEEEGEEEGDRRRGGSRGGGGGRPRPQQGQGLGQGQRWKETLAPMTVQCVDYFADRKEAVLEVTVREGRDRLLRQAFAQLGHPVKSVARMAFGPIELGPLRAGEARRVSLSEVARLRGMLAAYRRKAARKGRRGGERGAKKGGSKAVGGKGEEDDEDDEDPDIEAFWDAVEDEEEQEEDGFYEGDDF